MIKSAIKYRECGISTIATDANKRSVMQWKKYQEQIGTDDDFAAMFGHPKARGLAVVCGAVSGSLEVVDVDCKYDLTGTLFDDLMQRIVDDLPEIAGKLVIAKTVGGGYHLMYRCDVIEGNLKLASRPTTDEERVQHPHQLVKVLVETRGEGGYVVAVPTEGYAYTSGKPQDIIRITPDQREILLGICRSFNQVHEHVSHKTHYVEQRSFNKSPFDDYNERGDIIGLLVAHGWTLVSEHGPKVIMRRPGDTKAASSGDYHRDKGLFAVFTTSTQFEPQKGYRPCAVFCMLECGGDWKQAARKLLDAGYGEPFKKVSRDIKKFIRRTREDGIEGEQLAAKVASRFSLSLESAMASVASVLRTEEASDKEFWTYDPASERISIRHYRLARFLEENGFGLYFYDPASPIFKLVHNDHNRLEEATTERIKKFVEKYIMTYDLQGVDFTTEELLEVIYRDKKLLSDALYEYLQPVQLDFLRDTANTAYFPFRNGMVEVTPKGIQLRNHGAINKVIWKSNIIQHTIDIDYSAVTADNDPGCEFLDFLTKALGSNTDKVLSTCSIIGYLLHRYKHPARAYAVIIGEETEDEAKGGGTGKGIIMKAIEQLLNCVTLDGKGFNPDKNFAYQRAGLATNIIVIQDALKAFPFAKLYSIITEGLTIEKKNKDELYVPYADSPKVVITTNYTVPDEGNHAKRRQKVIELSPYFSPNRTPLDEYGHLLFDDWDTDEWNRFYNFMFWCVQLYLERGVIDMAQGEQYRMKKVKVQYGDEFCDWFQEYSSNGCADFKELNQFYQDFLNINNFDKKDYSPRKFTYAMRMAAENLSYELMVVKKSEMGGKRYVKMVKNTE
jgi:hypothetical protein